MVKQTQDQWLNSKYFATSQNQCLSFPNFKKLLCPFDIDYLRITKDTQISKLEKLKKIVQKVFL